MILQQNFETLKSIGSATSGTFNEKTEINLRELAKESKELCGKWQDFICDNSTEINFQINDDMRFIYKTTNGETREADMSEYAFGQLCTRLGVPAGYVKKCFDSGKVELALENFQAWAGDCDKSFLVREQDGIVRAVLSESYKTYDSHRVLKTLQNTVDADVFKANSVFMSTDKLHIRFINRTPLKVEEASPIYSGFTVSSSDVGRGSLMMNYFLFRQICSNGMTVTEKGGTLFRQPHIGSAMTDGKLDLFNKAFRDIDSLNNTSVDMIRKNQSTMLKEYELNMYLEKTKRELKLSEKSQERLNHLIFNTYDNSRWGLLNGITELAQDFTLDTRIEFETFAGNMMMKM